MIEQGPLELSVLIVTYNCATDAVKCVASVREHLSGISYEILVRDNGSRDADQLRGLEGPDLRLVLGSDNIGFGRANNEIAALARGRYLVCLNPDTLLKDRGVATLPGYLRAHPEVGTCCPLLQYPDGTIQDAWGEPTNLWWDFCEGHYLQGLYRRHAWARLRKIPEGPWSVGFVSGACLCLSNDLWKDLGGFDPGFFLNHEDVEICDRIRAKGLEVHLLPWIRIVHAEGLTQRTDWRRYTFHRQQGKWIYLTRRYRGAPLLVARILWWESILLKLSVGTLFLRGGARSRLGGFVDAMAWVVRR